MEVRMITRLIFLSSFLCIGAFSLCACSGGGGGGTSASIAAVSLTPATPTSVGQTTGMGSATNTGIVAGPIAAPAAASFGTAQKQLAVPGGQSFAGAAGIPGPGGFPTNVTFPLTSISLKAGSTGLAVGS